MYVFVYKICHNLLPEWLFSFPTVGDTKLRHTRQSEDLVIPRTKAKLGENAVSVR